MSITAAIRNYLETYPGLRAAGCKYLTALKDIFHRNASLQLRHIDGQEKRTEVPSALQR